MNDIERNLGQQPLLELMTKYELKPHDIVSASPVPMTHKMISRATKGRRLTSNTKNKILTAFNIASTSDYSMTDLFNY